MANEAITILGSSLVLSLEHSGVTPPAFKGLPPGGVMICFGVDMDRDYQMAELRRAIDTDYPRLTLKPTESVEERKERLRVLANHGRRRAW